MGAWMINRVLTSCHFAHLFHKSLSCGGGDRGAGDREKRGGRCTGGGRRGGGKRDSQGAGKQEKKRKIVQYCAIFRNRKKCKGAGTGIRGYGKQEVQTPLSPPPPHYLGARLIAGVVPDPLTWWGKEAGGELHSLHLRSGLQITKLGATSFAGSFISLPQRELGTSFNEPRKREKNEPQNVIGYDKPRFCPSDTQRKPRNGLKKSTDFWLESAGKRGWNR